MLCVPACCRCARAPQGVLVNVDVVFVRLRIGVASLTVFQSTDIYMGDEACVCTHICRRNARAGGVARTRSGGGLIFIYMCVCVCIYIYIYIYICVKDWLPLRLLLVASNVCAEDA